MNANPPPYYEKAPVGPYSACYPHQQVGYPPQQVYPPAQSYPGYVQQQVPPPQSSTNVVVVSNGYPVHGQTVIIEERREVNHLLHFCITLFFPIWIFVWIALCMIHGA